MTVDAPQSLGDYQLLALLATGGMAEIYLAKDKKQKKLGKLVVVKRIFPHLAKQQRFVDMFLDEGNIAAQLDHPNIVKILESSRQDDEYFIAMEYLEGESLGYLVKQLRKNARALPTPLAAGIVAQVCAGLQYAHTLKDKAGKPMNIVHRDVSPHNIIILYSGAVKLVDFGIAKAASKIHKTRVGTLKGKLTYISPEQYKSGAVDARSDVFSLGVVFWELLTRRRLFKRETEKDMMKATLSGTIPRIRDIQAGVSPELEEVAHKALQLKPEDRYQSAAVMEKAIRQALSAIGATCEDQEIADFVGQAFEERAKTKQRLLREISAQPEGQEPCDVSQSEIIAPQFSDGDDTADEEPEEEATPVDQEEDIMCEVPTANVPNPMRLAKAKQGTGQRKIHPAVWLALPLTVLLVVGIVLLSTGDRSDSAAESSTVQVLPDTEPTPAKDAGLPPGDATVAPGPVPGEDTPAAPAAENPEEAAVPAEVAGPAPRKSVLTVRSRPAGCRVKVDGTEVEGLTPQERVEVREGMNHRVSVLCKDHFAETKQVMVSTGERITLDFAPSRRPHEPRVTEQHRPPPAEKPADKPRPKVAARSRSGYLRLDTVPWSEVYLGERKLGITPLVKQQLPAGTHVLTAVNLARQLKKSFKVTIKPGQITKLRLSLSE